MAEQRKSHMEFNCPYFYTATILHWHKLLDSDKYKQIIVASLRFLAKRQLVKVYGFVIMPNHIHLIWELLKMNGNEKPNASFLKFTAHSIEEDLRESEPAVLENFEVSKSDRRYHFWQRDSLAIPLFSEKVFEQKLRYIHLNPLQEHWQLVEKAEEYFWSSAEFYENGKDAFGFLTDYRTLF
jgi:REP element-mobilizing transposase RayT